MGFGDTEASNKMERALHFAICNLHAFMSKTCLCRASKKPPGSFIPNVVMSMLILEFSTATRGIHSKHSHVHADFWNLYHDKYKYQSVNTTTLLDLPVRHQGILFMCGNFLLFSISQVHLQLLNSKSIVLNKGN